ncbi:MAG: hypothetical protein KGH75_00930 [Rhodospirillales bacterium]|nr:hypothetical protein [Rhodospirillales bacterium]
MMTAPELRALGAARYGHDWQSALARAVGVNPRHMRRLAAGTVAITEGMAADILRALGRTAPDHDAWPRDLYITGDCAATGREYVIRTRAPRFIARVVALGFDGEPEPEEAPVDTLAGVTYAAGGFLLAEISWIDAPPPEAELHRLLAEAAAAIEDA